MKRKVYFISVLTVLLFSAFGVFAQTPQYQKCCGAASSQFPFKNDGGAKTQLWYDPADFTTLPPSGDITTIYFRSQTGGQSGTYNNFRISFKQPTSGTGFSTSTTFETGLTQVHFNALQSVTGGANAGDWYAITLNTPYAYDNTKPLVVEILFDPPFGGGGIDNLASATSLNRKIYAGSASATTGTASNGFWQDFGMDILTGPCTAPPVAGDATASTGYVCSGTNVSFGIVNATSGSGQTYEWQSASTIGGPYTTISGVLTSAGYSTAVTSSAYYRAAITCSGQTSHSNPVYVEVGGALSGTYTINAGLPSGAGNFQNFSEFVTALSCAGITGPVTVNVASGSGPYNEQVIFTPVTGASSTNTITINGNDNVLSFASSVSAERATLKLDGADYFTIKRLDVQAIGTTYGYALQMINDADNNIIDSCTISTSTTTTSSTSHNALVISGSATSATTAGSLCDNNIISNNTIVGGYYSMTLITATGNQVLNNRIQDYYVAGIYFNANDNLLIKGNDITRPTRTNSTTSYGIGAVTANANVLIDANRVHNSFGAMTTSTSTHYGLYSSADATAGNEIVWSNNLVYDIIGGGILYGIYNTGGNSNRYYHNTIVLDDQAYTGSSASRGFYQTTAATNLDIKNNIFYVTRSGTADKYGIYINTATTTFTSDNNDFYINATVANNHIGYLSGNKTLLTDWQSATSGDANSVTNNPLFQNLAAGDLEPTNTIDNLGAPVGIATDINGASRSATTPDIGAYEFTIPVCTAPPTAGNATASSVYICGGASVNLGITGNTSGLNQTYEWQSSSTLAGPYTSLGAPAATPGLTVSPATSTYYQVVVTCSGQPATSNPVYVEVNNGLTGTYTINAAQATGMGNFQSFGDFITALSCNGVIGPVVVNVVPGSGPYNEQVIFGAVAGTSATNTITINGNDNILAFAATVSAQRATLKLDGADYFIIKRLDIQATGTSYGFGVQLINDADSNTIDSCTISTSTTLTSSTTHNGFVISGSATSATTTGSLCDHNIISNNTIVGGYYCLSLIGNSVGTHVLNNKIQDFYAYGIYSNANDSLLIKGNDITRPTRTNSTTAYGIAAVTANTNVSIDANRVHNMFGAMPASTSTCYPLYSSADAAPADEIVWSNNAVYDIVSAGTIYGIYNAGGNSNFYYHNSILLDDQTYTGANATRGVYQTTAATGLDFKNNIISITRGGTSDKHAIYLNEPTTVATADNNDYYVNSAGAGINYIAYLNATNYATLASWQAATSQDLNSLTVDPAFQNPATGDFTPTGGGLNDGGAPVGILTDINGLARSATTPDIGAVEFTPPGCTAPPAVATATSSAAIVCSGDGVTLDLTNITHGLGQTYVWQSAPALAGPYTDISTPTNAMSFNTVVTVPTYYRAVVTCSGQPTASLSVFVDIRPPLAGGIYTINSAQPTAGNNFASFTDAATAMSCGISSSVIINVAAGVYNEQVFFNAIPGTSPSNTITINGNGATISYVSTITNQRDIIRLDGTDYLTINNLNITSSGSSSSEYAIGVHLINDADNNTINSCNILLSTTTTSTNFAGISISAVNTSATGTGDANCDNNVFINNTITGGSYGVALTANGLTFMNQNNQVINNSIKDCYTYAIYVNGGNNTLIQGNDISRPTRSTVSTFYGVALVTGGINNLVSNNRIHDGFAAAPTSTPTAYGLYSSADATVGNPNIFANNIVYNFSSDGDQYGMYNTSAPFNSYYHNTIVFNDVAFAGTDVTRGFYQTTAATDIIVKNNIIYITRGGTGDKHGYYFNTSTSAITTDNNVLYINGAGGVNYIGRDLSGTDHATLAAWQAATSADAASLSADPVFAAPASADFTPTVNTVDNIGAPVGITTDINGAARSITTPDVGAYEFTGFPLAVKLINFNATRQAENVHTSWTTATEADMDKYIVERSVNGREFIEVGIVKSIGNSNATHTYGFTDITAVSHAVNGKLYYRLRMTETSGRTDYSDVAVVNVNNTYLTDVQVYPNPFSGYVMVNTTMQSAAKAVVSIKDIVGKGVYRIEYEMPQGRSSHRIDNLQHLPAGVYEISINVNGEQVVQKLVK